MPPPVGPGSPPSQSCPQHLQQETDEEELDINIHCLHLDTKRIVSMEQITENFHVFNVSNVLFP